MSKQLLIEKVEAMREKGARKKFGKPTLADTISANQKAMAELQKITQVIRKPIDDRERVEALLKSWNCDDEEIAEVLQNCRDDAECRKYYVQRAINEL